ncbi:efflux RND transporter periplasmic adaptor subunit [Clostridium thailandense]|nr:efflux RND transporter periplasmic adaptor subunit [Clostridium thailandense]
MIKGLKMSKRKTIITILVIAIVLVVGKNAFSGKAKKTTVTSGNKVSVKTQKVEEVTSGAKASFKASLEAVQEGAVTNKVGGKVTEVLFENGQTVTEGQALVKLDDTDVKNNVASSEAQLTSAEAQLKAAENQVNSSELSMDKMQTSYESAKRDYDRKKALYDQGAIAKTEFESAETALKNAQTDLSTAQNSIESAKLNIETQKANINSAQVNLNTQHNTQQNTTITAPISGVMDGKNVSLGQYVNIGTTLGKVKNISSINAVIQVKDSDLSYIKVGGKATLKLDGENAKEYEGTIQNIDAVADSSSRVFTCKIAIDNKNGELKPGVFGNVEIETGNTKKSISLPTQALGGSEGNYYVFINNKGVAKKSTVTTGEVSKDNVEIKSGIKSGDEVIITNVSTLLEDEAITVVSK